MQEPNWEDIIKYCDERANTLFVDAQIVIDDDRFGNKQTFDLAYEYYHLADHIEHLIKAKTHLLTGEVLSIEPITHRKRKRMKELGKKRMITALELLRTKRKSIYPLCYCKVCKGDTKHKDCPNQDNPHRPPNSIWFRALRGEPTIAVGRG